MAALVFQIHGAGAEAAAAALSPWLAAHGLTPSLSPLPPAAGVEALRKGWKPDPVAVAALVMAIPGAFQATADLADRITQRDTAKALLAQIQQIQIDNRVQIFIVASDGLPRPLETVTADTLLELANPPAPPPP